MMDVRLPDGRIIRNVPDGMTQAQLAEKLRANGIEVPADWATQAPAASDPAAGGMSAMERFGQGIKDPISGGAQLLTNALPSGLVRAGNEFNNWLAEKTGLVGVLPPGGVDEQVRQQEADYQAKRKAGGQVGIDWARLLGNVASPVNLAAGAGASSAATLGGRMLAGGLAGAGASALAPVTEGDNYATQKAKQMLVGGAVGAAVPAVVAGVGRMLSPKASTDPGVALLRSEGVKGMTVGQTMGGAVNTVEEKLQSLPIAGDMIRYSRGKALEQFDNAAINRATAPIGVKVSGVGTEAVQRAHQAISNAYDDAAQKMGTFQLDRQASLELLNLHTMAQNLPTKEAGAFNALFDYLSKEVSPNGSIVAEGFKRFDAKAGKEVATFAGSTDAYQQQAATAMQELQRIVREAGKRANPDAAAAYNAADTAFANLVRVEQAAKAAVNNGGVFTPGQLGLAVRATDRSVRDNATAQGKALMQDLAQAGQAHVGNKFPNSGTFDRAVMGAGALGAAAIEPNTLFALGGGGLLYSPPVQRALTFAMARRPGYADPIAQMLNQASPMLSPAGGLLALDVLGQ